MTNEVTEQNKEAEALPAVPFEPDLRWLTGGILSTKFPQREWINHKPSITQAKILLHIYKNEGVSLKQLRSIFKLSGITSYRHLGFLKRIGAVKWKGSHKAGGYIMTEEGMEFVKTAGDANKLEYYRKKWEQRYGLKRRELVEKNG
jgi:hypothetical protein